MNAVHHLTQKLSETCAQNHVLRSTLEEYKKSLDGLSNQLTVVVRERDEVKAHLEKRIKELVQEHNAKNRAEARCAELEKVHSAAVAESFRFANDLIVERDAHNKLKALCNERGFGTPLFYTPPTLPKPEPTWTVSFYQKDIHLGDITYTRAPSTKLLNDLQESLKATSWKLIYRG